jgi:hypothetical protein
MSHPSPTLTLDLFVKVAQTTVLNPLFSMWVPILTLSQVRSPPLSLNPHTDVLSSATERIPSHSSSP